MSGRFSKARAIASFWRWPCDSRAPPTPTWKFEADLQHRAAQLELVEDLDDQLADALGGAGLPVGELAEQDVVLQRRRGVVGGGVEEFDRGMRRLRQAFAECVPRLEHPRLDRVVEQAQAMPAPRSA